MQAKVTSVSKDATHSFSKLGVASIRLLAGIGAEGDTLSGLAT